MYVYDCSCQLLDKTHSPISSPALVTIGGYLESLPLQTGASVGSTPSGLGWDKGALQGHQAYPAKFNGGITHQVDPRQHQAPSWQGNELPGC